MEHKKIDLSERCDCTVVHEDVVERVRSELPEDEILYDLADLFRVFADTTRIKILYALFEAELCVCDLSRLTGMSQSAVSHQLRTLKDSKLVRFRREGKTVYYSLADQHVRTLIGNGMEHVLE
ncbi:MAG: metalloregulator ArsR/SmtB family transcription factor [Oscillospiraceae bacterium]|nr:metalloregulator ArsR/SmtB family transcription factor [Oscillospiraceae bacterium]